MATHVGTTGSITATETTDLFTSTILVVSSWTLDLNQDVVDVTGFQASSNWRTKLAGLNKATGSASGFLAGTIDEVKMFETPGTPIAFVLKSASSGGVTYTGNTGYMTSFSTSTTVGEAVSFSCTFDISGVVSVA
jgi:predicted secreted protein